MNISSLGDEPGIGPAGSLAGRGGPTGRLMVHEERICSTYSLLICFALFHAFCDFITLISLGVEKDRLVLPLLLVLALNILVSCLFIASALFTFLFASSPRFDGVVDKDTVAYFFFFVLVQTCFRLYEFVCARRLYWYYQFCADVRQMPQSSLLRNDDDDSMLAFQF
uniref:Transmembrane protein n=1 Tax=Ditylenchus dipsaci TaxID=166011 RepID=A0A915D2G5_9BILA